MSPLPATNRLLRPIEMQWIQRYTTAMIIDDQWAEARAWVAWARVWVERRPRASALQHRVSISLILLFSKFPSKKPFDHAVITL